VSARTADEIWAEADAAEDAAWQARTDAIKGGASHFDADATYRAAYLALMETRNTALDALGADK